jgi:hypothetical protein
MQESNLSREQAKIVALKWAERIAGNGKPYSQEWEAARYILSTQEKVRPKFIGGGGAYQCACSLMLRLENKFTFCPGCGCALQWESDKIEAE